MDDASHAEDDRRREPPLPLPRISGWVLLLVTAVLIATQWELVSNDETGKSNSLRDTGLAILIGLAGLRLVAVGRHPLATVIAAAAGIGLILGGFLAEHDRWGLAWVEVGCGVVAVVAALTSMMRTRGGARDVAGISDTTR